MAPSLARSATCFFACTLAACGPIGATSLIADAEVALARAHAADGEKLAPYETTLADLYLVKAREEQGHAKYSDAKDLAEDCIHEAELAAKKAAERKLQPAAPASPAPMPAAVAPARPAATSAPAVAPAPGPAASPGSTPAPAAKKQPFDAPADAPAAVPSAPVLVPAPATPKVQRPPAVPDQGPEPVAPERKVAPPAPGGGLQE